MDYLALMPGSEALVPIGKAHLDRVQILIWSELNIGWEVPLSQQGNNDWEAGVHLRDRIIDRADYNDGSTVKGSKNFREEYLNRIYNRSYQ